MRLEFKKQHKSITSLDPIDLPGLMVVTGKNGAGKTHLLEAIECGHVQLRDGPRLVKTDRIQRYDEAFSDRIEQTLQHRDVEQFANNLLDDLQQLKRSRRRTPKPEIASIAKLLEIPPESLRRDHFRNFGLWASGKGGKYPSSRPNEIPLASTFKAYQLAWAGNVCNRQLAEKDLLKGRVFTDSEFRDVFGEPPWELVNRAVSASGCHFDGLQLKPLPEEEDLEVRLKDRRGRSVPMDSLSSGEALVLKLMMSLYGRKKFPAVVLADEIAYPLHPGAMRDFVQPLQRDLVEESGVRVILVTHSPSLVALCPEDSLHLMRRGEPRLTRVGRNEAIAELTAGVPSLRIEYETTRQVFVESDVDARIYERLFDALRGEFKNDEIGLKFVSAGQERGGGSAAVIRLTKDLLEGGSQTTRGIVDCDGGSGAQERGVEVLGPGERYAVENAVLDPLVVAGLLADAGALKKDFDDARMCGQLRSHPELQAVVDHVTSRTLQNLPPVRRTAADQRLVETRYVGNDFVLRHPAWFLHENGKVVAEAVLGAFPQLAEYTKGRTGEQAQQALMFEAVDRILTAFSEFIPQAFPDLFRRLQKPLEPLR